MASRKIVLTFPPELVDKPIIHRLTKDFDLEFNILKAAINQNEEGLMVLELKGANEQLNKAITFLRGIGVKVEPLSKDVVLVNEQCVSCGACIPHCPVAALIVDPVTYEVSLDDDRCIACEICVRVCPYHALELRW